MRSHAKTLLLALATIAFASAMSAQDSSVKSDNELDIEGMIAIRFYNEYEPMLWSAMHMTEAVESNIRHADAAVQKNSGVRGLNDWRNIGDNSLSALTTPVRVPNFFAKENIATLRSTSDKFKASALELAKLNDSLTEYFDYKNSMADQAKKYAENRDRLVALLKETRTSLYAFNDPALKLAQAGEARTLPKNPCGIYLLHMRELLDQTDQLATILRERADNESGADTAAKLDALCGRINALVAKYKDDDTAPITKLQNESARETCLDVLKRFYGDQCPDLVVEIKSFSDALRAKQAITDTRRASSLMGALTQGHDRFVEMYNNWTGGDQAVKRGEAGQDD